MGYTTQEFATARLTNSYPSLYREFQMINWSHVDVVITEPDGEQTVMARSDQPVRESDACVVIESIKFHGARIQEDSTIPARDQRGVQMPAKRFQIPFESFHGYPVRVEEFNCIISTVEQSMIAKNMAYEMKYGALVYENQTDVSMTDPRFVFQVIDPNHMWTALLVNVFGQTISLRAGQFGQIIPTDNPQSNVLDQGKLICYLKYPTAYSGNVKDRQIVFEIPLGEIRKKEPFRLPSGDIVCVAEDVHQLSEVMEKKSSSFQGIEAPGNALEKMIPKDVYDAAEANFKADCERIRQESKQRLESLTIKKENEISKLQRELTEANNKLTAAEAKVKEWEAINDTRTHVDENRQRVALAEEKVKKEANDNAQADIEFMKTAVKLGGTIVSGVLSFAITLLVQTAKKK